MIGCLPGAGGQDCDNGVIAKIYINNGTTLNENQTWQQNLTSIGYGSLALGDIDNDGDLDLAQGGCTTGTSWSCNGNRISKIYLNNGTSFVESSQWQNNLIGVFDSSMSFGDIDNDGKLDLVINGRKIASPYDTSNVYINNGTSFVESSQWQSSLIGVHGGQLSLGDIDNDGDLDLALTGDAGSSIETSKIYINNGTSFVENSQWQSDLTSLVESTALFGDYNNDNKLDLVLTGNVAGDFIYVYKNNGTSLIENQTRDLPGDLIGVYYASLAFGDYDNDGDLDLIEIGNENGDARVFENNESDNYYFRNDALAHANISNDLYQGSVTWEDIDNDNDLDLIITGADFGLGTSIAKIFINNNTIPNTQPNSSTSGFSSSYLEGILNLSWGNGSDIETPTGGLYYNLMVGNSTTNHTIVSGVYGGSSGGSRSGGAANGYFGNMMQRKSISLNKYLSAGTYYWYVQTIDTGLAKSNWSSRQSIIVSDDTTAPVLTSISSSVTSSSATITWTTDESSNSSVYYGTTTATTSSSGSDDLVTSHSISLSGLSASTLYYYNVSSCDYWANCNTSSQYSFTTSAAGNGGNGGSSNGGTAGFWTNTYTVSDEDFEKGIVKELSNKQRVKISINNEAHYIGVVNLTNTTATINITSNPIQVILSIGEEAKIDVLDDGFYDLFVRLNGINEGKANLTIKSIHEEIPEGEGPMTTTGEEVEGEEERKKRLWLYGLIVVGVVVIVIIFFYLKKHLWKREFKNRRKKWYTN